MWGLYLRWYCAWTEVPIQALDRTIALCARARWSGGFAPRHHVALRRFTLKTGQVIGQCHRRHRALESASFLPSTELDALDADTLYGIRNWFAKRPRFHIHFTLTIEPGGALVGLLTESSCAVSAPAANLRLPSTVTFTNEDPKVWTKRSNPGSVAHFCQRTLNTGH